MIPLRSCLVCGLLGMAAVAPLAAQQTLLDAAESRLAAGEHAQARDLVERWWGEHPVRGSEDARTRPRALLLRGRLATDFAAAEKDFLAIVLGHPASAEAPEALLRLGQGLVAHNDPQRAAAYLERLLADYPGAKQWLPGQIWLAKARAAAGRKDPACAAARAAVSGADPTTAPQASAYEAAFCGAGETFASARSSTGRFAVQVAAFRDRARAERLAAALRRAGHDPRLASIPGSGLTRVRIGRFANAAGAAELLDRLRAAGHDGTLVADVDRERSP